MSEALRVGLVGCGRAAERLYVPSIPRVRGGRIVAVSDMREDRRSLLASQFDGAEAYESLDAMLERAALDAVIVATPPSTHVAVARQALERGAWVLVEKPLAPTLAEARSLLHTSSNGEAAKRVMVGYNRRYWEPVQKLRAAMSGRDRSRPVEIDAVFSIDASGWDALSGPVDPIDDLASHYLDLLRYIFDEEFTAVRARWPDPKTVHLDLTMTGGVTAHLEHAHTDHTTEHLVARSGGRSWAIRMGSQRITPAGGAARKALDLADKVKRKATGGGWTLGESYVRQFERFFAAVRASSPPRPGVEDGIAVLRATEAARSSADLGGQEVHIDGDG